MPNLDESFFPALNVTHARATTLRRDLSDLVTEITYHPLVKILLLHGYSANDAAKFYRIKRATVSQVTRHPFTALEGDIPSPPVRHSLFDEQWEQNTLSAREALNICMDYDTTHFEIPAPDVLATRYNITAFEALRQVQKYHAKLNINTYTNFSPPVGLEAVECIARLLGCTDEQITRAKESIEDWLATPVVPEITNAALRVTSVRDTGLLGHWARTRHERETDEFELYGASRPIVDDTDTQPCALARDLILKIIGEIRSIKGREHLVSDFAHSLDIRIPGSAGRAMLADTDEDLVDLVDQALYRVHGVHLPNPQADTPWPHTPDDLTAQG